MLKLVKTARMMIRRPPEVVLRSAICNQTERATLSLFLTSTRKQSHKAAVCTELGKPLDIKGDVPVPQSPGSGEVLVAVRSAGINFADVLICAGLYQEKPPLPFIPGSEVSGRVLAVGDGVTNVAVNDRVVALPQLGGYAEQCLASSARVWKIPDNLPYSKAAAMLVSYGTAFMALVRTVQVKPGETVLITAAAGALGLAAVDLAVNTFGCKVIAACGGEEKVQVVRKKGAHHVIDYTKESVRDKVKEITKGEGVNVVLDPVGGKVFLECIRSAAFEGRIVTLGYASGDIPNIPANLLLVKSCSVSGLYWGSYSKRHPAAFYHSIDSVLRLSKEGKISPHVPQSFPLEQANEAFTYLQSRKSTGKVSIEVSSD